MTEIRMWLVIARQGGEIGIKSHVTRRRITRLLKSNIQRRLSNYLRTRIRYFRGYYLIEGQFDKETALKIALLLSKYEPGIASTSPAISSTSGEGEIIATSLEFFASFLQKHDTFAVRVKREGQHNYSSVELAAKIGAAILNHFSHLSLKVDLTTPQHELYVDIKQDLTFYYYQKIPGLSGYPPGMQGYSIGLLRPCNFDFMALFLVLRRGVLPYPVFLESDRCLHPSSTSNEKLIREYFLKMPSLSIDLTPLLENTSDSPKCVMCVIIRSLVGERARQQLGADGIVDGISFSDINPQAITTMDQRLNTRKLYPLLLNPQELISFPFSIPIHAPTPKPPISEQDVIRILQDEKSIEKWKEYILKNLHEPAARV